MSFMGSKPECERPGSFASCFLVPLEGHFQCSEKSPTTAIVALKRACATGMLKIARGCERAVQGVQGAALLQGPCRAVSVCLHDAPCACCVPHRWGQVSVRQQQATAVYGSACFFVQQAYLQHAAQLRSHFPDQMCGWVESHCHVSFETPRQQLRELSVAG